MSNKYSATALKKGTHPADVEVIESLTEYDISAPNGAMVGIDNTKRLPLSLMPVEVQGAADTISVKLREAVVSAPKLMYYHHNTGDATVPNAYIADRTNERPANCVVTETGSIGDTLVAYRVKELTGLSGLRAGDPVYLGTSGAQFAVDEPTEGISQITGYAESATVMHFKPKQVVKL